MRLVLEDETRIRLVAGAGGDLEIDGGEKHTGFSPLHMLAASIATCTLSVLAGWAMNAGIPVQSLEIGLSWEYVQDPYRVGHYDMTLQWPDLPDNRHDAALRVARHCTVENTLREGTEINAAVV